MRKVFLFTTFLVLTPIVLVSSLSLLILSFHRENSLNLKHPKVIYAALPAASGMLKPNIIAVDARKIAVKNFFNKYKSDLLPFADLVVDTADEYGLDYRLIPAIAMQESGACKKAPKDSHNCWGFGIYAKKVTRFDNYPEAIKTVTKTLALQYKANGLETPEQIMTRYTPGSNGSWAKSVNHFMNALAIAL